jgi:hypothetical protein
MLAAIGGYARKASLRNFTGQLYMALAQEVTSGGSVFRLKNTATPLLLPTLSRVAYASSLCC